MKPIYNYLNNAAYRKAAAITLLLILVNAMISGQEIPKKDNSENMFNHKWSNNGYLDLNTIENSIFSITIGTISNTGPFKNNIRTEDLGFLEKQSTYRLWFIIKTSIDFPLILHYGEEDLKKSSCVIDKQFELKADEDFTVQSFEFKTNNTLSNSHLVFGLGNAPSKASIILTAIKIEKVK
jgi:hypothetical protein